MTFRSSSLGMEDHCRDVVRRSHRPEVVANDFLDEVDRGRIVAPVMANLVKGAFLQQLVAMRVRKGGLPRAPLVITGDWCQFPSRERCFEVRMMETGSFSLIKPGNLHALFNVTDEDLTLLMFGGYD
jgi:hypothetical protein